MLGELCLRSRGAEDVGVARASSASRGLFSASHVRHEDSRLPSTERVCSRCGAPAAGLVPGSSLARFSFARRFRRRPPDRPLPHSTQHELRRDSAPHAARARRVRREGVSLRVTSFGRNAGAGASFPASTGPHGSLLLAQRDETRGFRAIMINFSVPDRQRAGGEPPTKSLARKVHLRGCLTPLAETRRRASQPAAAAEHQPSHHGALGRHGKVSRRHHQEPEEGWAEEGGQGRRGGQGRGPEGRRGRQGRHQGQGRGGEEGGSGQVRRARQGGGQGEEGGGGPPRRPSRAVARAAARAAARRPRSTRGAPRGSPRRRPPRSPPPPESGRPPPPRRPRAPEAAGLPAPTSSPLASGAPASSSARPPAPSPSSRPRSGRTRAATAAGAPPPRPRSGSWRRRTRGSRRRSWPWRRAEPGGGRGSPPPRARRRRRPVRRDATCRGPGTLRALGAAARGGGARGPAGRGGARWWSR